MCPLYKAAHIFNKMLERVFAVKAFVLRQPNLAGMSLKDFAGSLFRSAWLRITVENIDITPIPGESTGGCRSVSIAGRTVYWPEEADPSGLKFSFWETYHDSHGHMFDTCGTEIKQGDNVVDCGACEGLFALKAIEKGAGKVYCIEPGRRLAECLRLTFSRLPGTVEVEEFLLGAGDGEYNFSEDPSNLLVSGIADGPSKFVYPVRMRTLDSLVREKGIKRIDYIKADVEGAEIELIKGAAATIAEFSPRISVAVYHTPDGAQRLTELIRSYNPRYRFRPKGIIYADGVVRPMILHCYTV
jgi:FkbM family methyltransferase